MRVACAVLLALAGLAVSACSQKSAEMSPIDDSQKKGGASSAAAKSTGSPTPQGLPTTGRADPTATAGVGGLPPTTSPSSFAGDGDKGIEPKIIKQAVASELEGKLERQDVEKTFGDNLSTFSSCLYEDTTVSVKLKIMPSGKVADARVPSSTPNDAKMRDCVAAQLRKLTFPKLKGVEPASLSMDLALRKNASY